MSTHISMRALFGALVVAAFVVSALFVYAPSSRAQEATDTSVTSTDVTPVVDTTTTDTTTDTPVVTDTTVTDPVVTDAPAATDTPVVDTSATDTPPADTTTDASSTDTSTDQPAAVVEAPVVPPTLSTDQADYAPGSVVTVFGHFFSALGNFVLHLIGTNPDGSQSPEVTQAATADANGDFTSHFTLDNIFRPLYNLFATDSTGATVAQTSFTDASGASIDVYSQCANGTDVGPTCAWTNGNLNGNNSVYSEGDATVQRLAIDGLTTGDHTVTIQYDSLKGGKHAYDYIVDDTFSENWVAASDFCSSPITNMASCSAEAPVLSGLIPAASNAGGYDSSSNRHFKIRNGSWVGTGFASAPTVVSGTDQPTNIQLQFHVDSATCQDKHKVQGIDTCEVLITFGAHISRQADWGQGNSAVNISGSPYHVRVVELDGTSIGNRDNQMQASAIILPSTITVHKVTSNGDTSTSFAYTTTGTGYSGFSLTGGAQNAQNVQPGSYSVTEAALSGWSLTGLTCAVGGGASATPNVAGRSVAITIPTAGGGTVDCTFTNTLQQAHLTLVKTVTNDNGGTAAATDWTLSAAGPTPISGATGSTNVTNAAVNAGAYTLSENGPSGYTASSWSCVGGTQNGGQVTLAAGDNATCTINNNDNPAHLIVIKHVINDNGGTAVASGFTTTISGVTTANPSAPGAEAPGVNNTLTTVGSYSVDEGAHVGYAKTLSADCSGTIALGETKTCTITNDDIAPSLTLDKVTAYTHGGTAPESTWTLTANGGAAGTLSGPGAAGHTDVVSTGTFKAGAYALSESAAPAGYVNGASYICSKNNGAATPGNSITLGLGDTAVCTITNTDSAPQLTVIKHVINDNGGTKTAADFTMNVTATNPSSASFVGAEDPGTTITLDAGSFAVTEGAVAGYTQTGAVGCSGTIAVGEHKTCTITNDDQPSHLIVIKHVDNGTTGATKTAADFQTTISGVTTANATAAGAEAPGVNNTLTTVGSYSVDEGAHVGYAKTLSADCSGTIALGETKTCTITNTAIAPTLTLVKHVINDNGGTAVAADFQGKVDGSSVAWGVAQTVTVGAHTASETNLPGYAASDWSNACAANGAVTLALGENKTCEITNNDIAPKLHLRKVVVNDNGGTKTVADFTLTANGTGANDLSGTSPVDSDGTLKADTWALSENNVAGYTASDWVCVGGEQNGANITVGIGGEATCTITNDDQVGHLKIVKNTVGGDDTFGYTVAGPTASTPTITTTNGSGDTGVLDVNAGNYSVTESTIPAGWAQTNAVCDTGTPGSFTVANGATVTCTYTNNKPAAQIDLSPLTATNKIGDNHVITATVQTQNGNGTWGPAANGTVVTFSITNSNGATASFVGSNTCTTTAGACSVTINSATAGTVAIHASASPVVLGVTLSVATGTGGDNSADAQKTYVDAQIAITGDSVNEVGKDHTFTVTVKKDLGDGAGLVAASGATVAGSITGTGSITGGTCSSGTTDASGQCTIVVSSATTGTGTVHASVTLSLGSPAVSITRATGDGLSGDSSDTHKTWVDANITISPLTATNNIHDAHVFTVTVTQIPSGATPATTANVVTLVTPTPDLTNSTTCTAAVPFVGNVATCTITINSSTPGDFTAGATATLTVGGVPLTRATGDGKSGDSANAIKHYVAGSLDLTKIVNVSNYSPLPLTNVDQTFTFHVVGPSYPTGHDETFTIVDGVLQAPTSVHLTPLIPGTYTVTENDPGIAWTVSGGGNVSVVANQTATATITNTIKKPHTTIAVTSNTQETQPGENVILTVTDTNDGQVPLNNPSVTLTYGATTVTLDKTHYYVSGDTNNNGVMDVGEAWVWSYSVVISADTTFNVAGHGTDSFNTDVTPANGVSTEAGAVSVKVIGTTRTLGFWQTHTTFTSYVFNTIASTTVGSGPVCAGTACAATHKGTLTSTKQLFGGFYAPMAKTTTGTKRTPVDQARINLLQQLLAAKLNCAAFGCSSSTQGNIAAADAAYAAGDKNAILNYSGILDAFNNSGDAGAIPSGLPATGKATPKDSQAIADLVFWNQP